ncbi:hypothetical protein CVT24_005474 [Panaeolus cyanescens]|uniref:Uncharacterized protein n=1 Tax=Panaeolus cyanescens TaxID=181874 RepID=A0A409WGL9_9AGAR|nr:hypothetical protein CVT24_005474 [Panaeolus cyanescens]
MLSSDLSSRIMSYVLVLGATCGELIAAGVSSGTEGFSEKRQLFGKITLGFAFLTFGWTLTLYVHLPHLRRVTVIKQTLLPLFSFRISRMAYVNRPLQSHILTNLTLHLVSFATFVPLWLALGILTLTQAPTECNFKRYSDGSAEGWCGFTVTSGVMGLLLAILCLVLSLGIVEMTLTAASAWMEGFSQLRCAYHPLFQKITIGVSLATWIWTSIILAHHNHPNQSHIFTKKKLHFWSFIAFVIVWLALGIMLLSTTGTECDFETYSDGLAGIWCAFTFITGGGALIISVFSATAAVFIHKSVPSADGNVAGPVVNVYTATDEEKGVTH